MIGARILITGALAIKSNVEKRQKEMERNLATTIKKSALIVEADVKNSMRGTGKPHTPSSPGEPPAVDTGKLRASITHQFNIDHGILFVKWWALVGIRGGSEPETKNYGYYLEREEIKNRPFLLPALTRNISNIQSDIRRAVRIATS